MKFLRAIHSSDSLPALRSLLQDRSTVKDLNRLANEHDQLIASKEAELARLRTTLADGLREKVATALECHTSEPLSSDQLNVILNTVCEIYNIDRADLIQKSGTQARQLAAFHLFNDWNQSIAPIAEAMKRDPTTIRALINLFPDSSIPRLNELRKLTLTPTT